MNFEHMDQDQLEDLREEIESLEKSLSAIRAASHNFYVTVKPWLHHESDMLKATIADLKHELAKGEKDGVYLY